MMFMKQIDQALQALDRITGKGSRRLARRSSHRSFVTRLGTLLNDAELAAVLNWVLEEFNRDTLPTSFTPLNGREVGKSRAQVMADPRKIRNELWPIAYED